MTTTYSYPHTWAIVLEGGGVTTSKGRTLAEAWRHFLAHAGSHADIRLRARTIEACGPRGWDPAATVYAITDGQLVLSEGK